MVLKSTRIPIKISNANSYIDKKLNNKNNDNHVFGSDAHQNPRITSNLYNGQTLSHRNYSLNSGSVKAHEHNNRLNNRNSDKSSDQNSV
jgi:hypothetical protein